MRHVEVGHQLVGKISMLKKTVKTPKNTIGKKIIILSSILLTKALNLPKVMYVLGTLIYFCKIISCMLYQSNLPFLLRNKVQCLTVGYMKMKLVYHVLSFFRIMLHSWSNPITTEWNNTINLKFLVLYFFYAFYKLCNCETRGGETLLS